MKIDLTPIHNNAPSTVFHPRAERWRFMIPRLKHFLAGPITHATLRTSSVLGLRLLAQVGTLLIVARLLGPGDFGAFAGMAALAVTLGALSTFGTHLLLLREVSRTPDQPAQLMPMVIATTLLVGGLLLITYWVSTTFWLRPSGMSSLALFAIGLSDIMLLPLLAIPTVTRQGQGHIARSQLLLVLPQVLRLLAASLVAWQHPQEALTVYALAYAAAALVSLPIGSWLMRHRWPHWRTWRLPNLGQWGESSGFAVLNLTALGPNELDKTMAVHLLPAVAAGTYAAASRVMGPLVLPVLAMMLSALPRLFREHADINQSTTLLRLTLLAAVGYGLFAAAALWMFSPIIAMFFGDRYAGLTETLRWLAFAVPGMTVRYVIGTALVARGTPWVRAAYEVVGVLVLAMTAVLLTPHLVDQGMASALAIAETSMALIGLALIGIPHRQKQGGKRNAP